MFPRGEVPALAGLEEIDEVVLRPGMRPPRFTANWRKSTRTPPVGNLGDPGLATQLPLASKEGAMPRQVITSADAPSSPFFSQAMRAGPYVVVSGTAGFDPNTGGLAGPRIQDQTRQALANCEAILRAAGAGLDDVVEVGILLADPADFAGMNEEYAEWFPADPPARYVARLGVELPGVLVSIRMTAFIS
jgi:enamine deaminase RidA (YjgF/YER057c/UK114 family)